MIRTFITLCIGATCLTACVNQKKFDSVRIVYEKGAPVSPGLEFPFGIVATKQGKKIMTKGYAGGKYHIDKYIVEVSNAAMVEGKAIALIDSTENRELDRFLKIVVIPVKNPSLTDSVLIPFNYEGTFRWYFDGEQGDNGDDKSARLIPIKIGGTGLVNGRKGEDGDPGTDGESVNLYVSKVFDDSFYARNGYYAYSVLLKTPKGDFSRFTYIADKYGKLMLSCKGGNGGDGGNGGRGVHGTDGDSRRSPGDGTNGGDGGQGGNGGNGGNVNVYTDSFGKDFLWYLNVQNEGGLGGKGGAGGNGGQGGTGPGGARGRDGYPGRAGSNGFNGKNGEGPIVIFRN